MAGTAATGVQRSGWVLLRAAGEGKETQRSQLVGRAHCHLPLPEAVRAVCGVSRKAWLEMSDSTLGVYA